MKARTGESPSFTAFIIACLGRAVNEHRYIHALRKGRQHLMLFGDVDVLSWIEREIAGQPHVLPCIVRAADRKTFREIHHDIRAAQVRDVARIEVGGAKASQLLPAWLFRPYFALVTRIGKWFPQEWKKRWGTVTISSVGMVGKGAGWRANRRIARKAAARMAPPISSFLMSSPHQTCESSLAFDTTDTRVMEGAGARWRTVEMPNGT